MLILFIITIEKLFALGEKKIMNKKTKKQYTDDVEKVVNFFHEKYFENIKFSDVLQITDIGENNFKKYFKDITGSSVMRYFKKYKIEQAKELIKKGSFNFTQISQMLGYDSIHYFSRQFKTIEGISPTEYKIKLQKEKL